jgi:hypothetical protein
MDGPKYGLYGKKVLIFPEGRPHNRTGKKHLPLPKLITEQKQPGNIHLLSGQREIKGLK